MSDTKPFYATKHSAGLDLHTTHDVVVAPGSCAIVDTDFRPSGQIHVGHVGLLTGRSGMTFKDCVIGALGIIDADYRGPVRAFIYNLGQRRVVYKKGERIAQMVVTPCVQMKEFDVRDEERGDGGFGHTGL